MSPTDSFCTSYFSVLSYRLLLFFLLTGFTCGWFQFFSLFASRCRLLVGVCCSLSLSITRLTWKVHKQVGSRRKENSIRFQFRLDDWKFPDV